MKARIALPRIALLSLGAVLLAPTLATAQPRAFNCIGAERLEDEVFEIPFARDAVTPGEVARTSIAAVAALARAHPERNLCVLGHAGAQEGGAQTGLQLAAKRARAVAEALGRLGVERDRVRAEARRAAFSRSGIAVPQARSVTVVLMP